MRQIFLTRKKVRKTLPSRWNHTIKYQIYFFGYCYYYNGFCHEQIDCRKNVKSSYMSYNNIDTYEFSRRNYNSFSLLLNYNIIWHNCNNYGNIENCVEVISEKIKKRKPQQPWKEIRNKENKTNKNPCSYKLHCVHKIIGIHCTLTVGVLVT
jgi:hypothetical protein